MHPRSPRRWRSADVSQKFVEQFDMEILTISP